ncbi:GntR family transcriptional regulator / MocR family aminotransferase [Sinosporangium album]|uniref:GntR family transcriptional regulator / MocR family aminotransferase n=1 Tax=Sinosporangium album TaxID=504805 RepID=A0A1G8C2S8_9ACTN|nr:PLP-dependent aminotransferase family protein [Sinosporangium album]SDH39618.1 GntR family transcriptional regulator / MocR family aminotransferase [Sinosporangium album]
MPSSPRRHIDLPVTLDRDAPAPLATQLGDTLRTAMRDGTLKHGERLPSSRGLARQLGVSRTVVTEAFQQLYAEGWLEGRHGSGTYVAGLGDVPPAGPAPNGDAAPAPAPGRPPLIELRPGHPWVHDYDDAAWRRAWRRAADLPPADDPDPYGLPRLREALAVHLRRARGMPVEPADVLVTRGAGNGLDLVAATLLRPGDLAGVEDPGYRVARNVFAARGARVVPCPVDDDGVIVERLPDDLRVLYTTPAHQYPLGGRLPIPRRERLLAWARRTGATIIEDDYDAEFRYDVAPLPALYGLDPARVVLLGTLSKSLTPDVGVGWLVAEPELLAAVARTRDDLADRTCGPAQAAVATLLERGDLERHLRRMRLEYARRRAAVVDALRGVTPLRGDTAGLHVVVELPGPAVPRIVAAAEERGVALDTLARFHQGVARVHGLVIGYGSASPADLRRAMEVVAELIAAETDAAETDAAETGGGTAAGVAVRSATAEGSSA